MPVFQVHEGQGRVVAALGPTNTGKTHRALERMLEHQSGMIGLPLRLLAREVYDRLTARLGEGAVSLITGEERRVAPRGTYWVCTVEAMPMDRRVEFVAVDEVQLAGHPQRGHVFTERLLHARGTRETWFLGASTIEPLLRRLIPEAEVERFERLSTLRHAGRTSLRGLPPRSAVVAFSSSEVYELAERLRRLRGGVAVVLGALSPRTRNAQVAMFQAGEVQHMVATDAIGMGLNLDIDHVALASLRKFDGREQRPLSPAEIGQIAGRAGRHMRDGSFGTLKPLDALPEPVVRMLESHRYPALERLCYRNARLDFSSLGALRRSLDMPAPDPALVRVGRADDALALAQLSFDPEVGALACDAERVALLWQVCQVPNFQKQLDIHHAASLKPFFLQLARDGQLDRERFAQAIARLDRSEGDIADLTDRLGQIRTFSYLSHRAGWLSQADALQRQTAAIEERLGEALHERLVERFVDRDRGRPRRRAAQHDAAARATEGQPRPRGPFAELATLRDRLPGAAEACQAPEGETFEALAARLEDAPHATFDVRPNGAVYFASERIGRLTAGRNLRAPGVAIADAGDWPAGARARVLRRLTALSRDLVSEASGGMHALQPRLETPAGRGLAYALEEGLGLLPRAEAAALWSSVPAEDRARLQALGWIDERRVAGLVDATDDAALRSRFTLAALAEPGFSGDFGSGVAHDFQSPAQALRFGYLMLERQLALRVDVWRALRTAVRRSAWEELQQRLGAVALDDGRRARVVHALGLREARDDAGRSQFTALAGRKRRRRRRRSDTT